MDCYRLIDNFHEKISAETQRDPWSKKKCIRLGRRLDDASGAYEGIAPSASVSIAESLHQLRY